LNKSLSGRLSGLKYALRLDVAEALDIPPSAVMIDGIFTPSPGHTQVLITSSLISF
jgi:hypothetical protein